MPAQIRAIDDGTRTVELSFSSEAPYERWFGPEILSHDDGSVDLSRLIEVGTVLFTHGKDPSIGRMPIASIDKAWIDAAEKKAKAHITFDDDEDSDKIYQKVKKKILKGVSVGYAVCSWEEVMPGKTSSNGRFTGPAYIALKWEPLEISIEPVPADPSVGVGRNMEYDSLEAHQNANRGHSRENSNSMSVFEKQLQINKNLL
ncbi:MAG TPA: caudovirus prohead protease [Negativicutes bacterium]|nr:caudovirus prohead protease [Negativicutes bacterium]